MSKLLMHQIRDIIFESFVMCSCFADGLCCCLSCCCSGCLQSLRKAFGTQRMTKLCYLFLVIIFTIPAIAILFFINKWQGFQAFFSWLRCPSSSGGQLECIGPSTIFRISLSFLALFVVMLIFMLFRNRLSMAVNQGCICIKYFCVLSLFIGLLFVSNQTINQYSQASKYISMVFLVLQSIILIDLFYLAGIKLIKRYNEGETECLAALVFLTLFFQTIAVGLNVLGYLYFYTSDDCGNSLWVNIVTSIIIFILPILQLININKQNSLLTTALVSMYISYLAFICQFSFGGSACTSRMTVRSIAGDIIVSTLFFLLTMYGTIVGGSGQVKISQNGDVNKAMGVAPVDMVTDVEVSIKKIEDKEGKDGKEDKNKKQEVPESEAVNLAKYTESWGWAKWHFYMCLASIYVAMLATNWTSASPTTGELKSNYYGFWVRVGLSWVTTLIYFWTLIAPKIFPQRDFSVK